MRSQTNIPCYFADVYHSTFDPPTDSSVVQRLVPDSKSSEKVMIERLMEYHRLLALQYITLLRNALDSVCMFSISMIFCRHIDGILMCYEKIYKSINVDQPKADVFSQGTCEWKWPFLLAESQNTVWSEVVYSQFLHTIFYLFPWRNSKAVV